MDWTLSEVRSKVRQLSGRLSVAESSNEQIDEYINKYFQYEFPAAVKLNRNYTIYEFNTEYGVRDYDFSDNYTNFVPEATLDRMTIEVFQEPDSFYALNPESVQRYSTWEGDGATVAFSNTYSNNVPISAGSVIVDDTVEVFEDNGAGVLVSNLGGVGGAVNYTTGVISVTFTTAPVDGQAIQCSFIQLSLGQPSAVMMFNNKFTFNPTPDKAYRFSIKAWTLLTVKPTTGSNKTSFTLASDRPLQDEWGPAIALGAARRIASDYGEMERYGELTALYKEQINLILTRTCIDLESTRVMPTF